VAKTATIETSKGTIVADLFETRSLHLFQMADRETQGKESAQE
jgi:hypothetical protein